MTKEEAINTLKAAIAEVEWNYPMDYAIAFEMAIASLRAQQERENPEPEKIKKNAGRKVTCYDDSGNPYSVYAEGSEAKHIIDLLAAEGQGRLVVLPCKVGDTIYMPVGRFKITGYEDDQCDGFHIARDGVVQIKARCYTGNHGTYGIPGKTVFLTREEADAALEAQKGVGE